MPPFSLDAVNNPPYSVLIHIEGQNEEIPRQGIDPATLQQIQAMIQAAVAAAIAQNQAQPGPPGPPGEDPILGQMVRLWARRKYMGQ
ncbi:hypothetical protein AOQ84DRAFT_380979 [Glonium stellatum]|uniref:Uncharacterized protein n=1 Tax=Glonium stellatum TaxID=574774 RepID=A0A8E2JNZ8_9PEZI|nr:hypothetical protein AOQ84DRAFT_380979 [Glonium stellatum]